MFENNKLVRCNCGECVLITKGRLKLYTDSEPRQMYSCGNCGTQFIFNKVSNYDDIRRKLARIRRQIRILKQQEIILTT